MLETVCVWIILDGVAVLEEIKMGMLETKFHEEFDSLTKQAFKDDCDINKMLAKHAKAGTLHTIQRD